PSGGSGDENISTARGMTMIAAAAFTNATIQTIANTQERTITVTGANARTYDVLHTSAPVRGPSNAQTENSRFGGVLASKTGAYQSHRSVCALWESPNGTRVLILVVSSSTAFTRYMDWHGIAFQIVEDFPHLVSGAPVGTDEHYDKVVFLAGADGGFV